MFEHMIVRLSKKSDPTDVFDLVFNFDLNDFTERWQKQMLLSQQRQDPISEPWAISGNNYWTPERSLNHINKHIAICNDIHPGLFEKNITDINNQTDLNYVHSIFELHHGKLNEWLDNPIFQVDRGNELRQSLSLINQAVHRLESTRTHTLQNRLKIRVVYFDTPKTQTFTVEDYSHFTNAIEFGGVYTMYADVGKNLESLAGDQDDDHHDFVPNLHWSSDFTVRFHDDDGITKQERCQRFLEENWEYFENKGYIKDDPRLTTGAIKLASLVYNDRDHVSETVRQYDRIQSVFMY